VNGGGGVKGTSKRGVGSRLRLSDRIKELPNTRISLNSNFTTKRSGGSGGEAKKKSEKKKRGSRGGG